MVRARGEALQFRARHAPHGDVRVSRYLKNLSQARFVRALRERQALDGTRARAQGFQNGLHAEDVRAVLFGSRPSQSAVIRHGHLCAARSLAAVRPPLFQAHTGPFSPRVGFFHAHIMPAESSGGFDPPNTRLVTPGTCLVETDKRLVATNT